MKALVIVDVQNDFCPGGALAVSEGDQVIEPINRLIKYFESEAFLIAFTRDWHPRDHFSFKENGGIWPVHCVAGSQGAEFHKDIIFPSLSILVSKTTPFDKEAFSGFQETGLALTLRGLGVETLIIAGLATDYSVKHTVLDALKLGFDVKVVKEAIRAVNVNAGDGQQAISEMVGQGAHFVLLKDIL